MFPRKTKVHYELHMLPVDQRSIPEGVNLISIPEAWRQLSEIKKGLISRNQLKQLWSMRINDGYGIPGLSYGNSKKQCFDEKRFDELKDILEIFLEPERIEKSNLIGHKEAIQKISSSEGYVRHARETGRLVKRILTENGFYYDKREIANLANSYRKEKRVKKKKAFSELSALNESEASKPGHVVIKVELSEAVVARLQQLLASKQASDWIARLVEVKLEEIQKNIML
jgi:hypothetical protein